MRMHRYHCTQCNIHFRAAGLGSVKLCSTCREDPVALRKEICRIDAIRFELDCGNDLLRAEVDGLRGALINASISEAIGSAV